MRYLLQLLVFLSSFIPYAVADSSWEAPPLDTAALGVTATLSLLTFIQAIIAIVFLFKGGWPHILPGILLSFGTLFLFLYYVLSIVLLVASFSETSWSLSLTEDQFRSISAGE